MQYIDRVNCFHQKTKTSIKQIKTPSLNRKLIKHIFYFLRTTKKLERFESEKEARFIKGGRKPTQIKLVSGEKQLKAASPTNGNFSSSRDVWRKSNTFKTLAVYLKNNLSIRKKYSLPFPTKIQVKNTALSSRRENTENAVVNVT